MKTGSSSIQHWLNRRSAEFAEQGIIVPSAFGPNMSRLAALAEAAAIGVEATPGDLSRLEAFEVELAALRPQDQLLVISAEMLGHQLTSREQLAFLIDLLSPFVDSFSVIVYLRRQDELSLSRYSTALRRGERRARPLSNVVNYHQVLELWASMFGRESIRPRIYDRGELIGGDVIQDFAATANLPFSGAEEKGADQNPSLLPEAQAFLADLAARVRAAGFDRSFEAIAGHNQINRLLSKRFRGKGMLPSRAEAQAFLDGAAESNEKVRSAWFPERETLFAADFSSYPLKPSAPPPPETVLNVAMEALVKLVLDEGARPAGPKTAGDKARRALDDTLRVERRAARVGHRRRKPKRDGAPG